MKVEERNLLKCGKQGHCQQLTSLWVGTTSKLDSSALITPPIGLKTFSVRKKATSSPGTWFKCKLVIALVQRSPFKEGFSLMCAHINRLPFLKHLSVAVTNPATCESFQSPTRYNQLFTYWVKFTFKWRFFTKMSQLGHYETIRTLGTCIGNIVHKQNPVKMTSLTMFRTTRRSSR